MNLHSYLLTFITLTILFSILLKNIQSYFPFDYPSERKQHKKPITLMGGLILSFSFLTISFHILPNWFIVGAIVTIIIGFIDDKINLNWRVKLFVQILLLFFISFNFWNQFQFIIFYDYLIPLNQIMLLIIFFFWFVGIYNAVNLIDGLDGLAAGFMVVLCTAASFLGNSQFKELNILFVICAIVFLIFNQRPAKTFMGDSGSLFLGYFLSTLPLLYYDLQSDIIDKLDMTPFIILVSFLIADTTRVFFTRIIEGKSPMTADTIHFHHMIIQRSGSYLGTLITIMAVSSISAFFAIVNNDLIVFNQTALIIHLSLIFLFVLTPPAPTYTKIISNVIFSAYQWDKKSNKNLYIGSFRITMMLGMGVALICSIFYNIGFGVLLSWEILLASSLLFVFVYINRSDQNIIYIIQIFISILLLEFCWTYSLNIFEKLLIIFQLFSFIVFTLKNIMGTKINHYSVLDILLFFTILIGSFLAIISFDINIWVLYAIASCWVTIGFVLRRTIFFSQLY